MRIKPRREHVDVVVVGTGSAGGILIKRLAEAGFKVVALEAGKRWAPSDFGRDPVQMRKLDWPARSSAGADPVGINGVKGVGGASLTYNACSMRARASDFRSRSLTGIADDWPITYEELEPYYDRVEREIGVAGYHQVEGDEPRGPYVMPPHRLSANGVALFHAGRKLGLKTYPTPMAINSRSYDGRPACMQLGCCNQGCLISAKGSTLVTVIAKAEKLGAEIRPECFARRIVLDERGRARGVVYFDGKGVERMIEAERIALCANAVETPRLLLNSANKSFPQGLANSSGLVGKRFMFHIVGAAFGKVDHTVEGFKGMPVDAMIKDFYDPDSKRGRMRGFIIIAAMMHPLIFAHLTGSTGAELKARMQDFDKLLAWWYVGEDLPSDENTITLDPDLKDANSIPIARVTHTWTASDKLVAQQAEAKIKELLDAAGAHNVWSFPASGAGAYHLMGTCRMGDDPKTSVVDSLGRAHDVPRLYIADGSVFVTSTPSEPTLTMQALALRTADHLVAEAKGKAH
ncbi:MAG: GMC family oxidoreductase [Acidobacteria bacterium]|nr:GMC family oxidoreductase [Acidobacteriota bacterium]